MDVEEFHDSTCCADYREDEEVYPAELFLETMADDDEYDSDDEGDVNGEIDNCNAFPNIIAHIDSLGW